MPGLSSRIRGRLLSGLGLVGAALYLLLSLNLVDEKRGYAVVDSPIFPLRARVVSAGWRLVPPGLFRLSYYPRTSARLAFHLPSPGRGRPVSSEGVGVEVEGSLTYRIPPSSVLKLHARARGDAEARVLEPMLDRTVLETVRGASFSRISGAHRFELEGVLAGRLGPDLRANGLDFVSLRVEAVRMSGGSLGGVSLAPIAGTRVLLIGLDGADWRVMDPLLAQGKLPNLERLLAAGVRVRLKTVDPVLSPVVWTTAATGFLPSEHGILDFLVTDVRTGERVPVTSRHRRVKAVWNLLDEAGVPVGVIGWWATWPAEPVDGFIVTDRVAYQVVGQARADDGDPSGKTFPPDLFRRILPLVVPPESITDADLVPFIRIGGPGGEPVWPARSENRLDEFRAVLAATRTYEGVVMALASGGLQPFEAVYFEGIDTTSHLFMPFRPPRRPQISEADYSRFSGAVDAFYVYQDGILGRLLEKTSPDTNILVLSDHGFRCDGDRPVRESRIEYSTAALWHRRYGILIASGPAFREGAQVSEASILDVAPTVLAVYGLPVGEDMQGRPIVDLFKPGFLREHPVRYRPTWETGRSASWPEASDPAGDKALKEKLLSLGYLSQEGTLSRNNLGNSLLAQGDVDGAIREFRRAMEEAPGFALPRINLARACMVRRDLVSARRLLEEAIRLTSDFTEAEVLLANVERGEGETAAAEARLRRVMKNEPSSLAHKSLGVLFHEQGRREEAAAEYRKAVQIDPEDPEGYNNLGTILKEEGRPEEAEAQFRKAIEADPDFAGSYNNLALVAMDRQDYDLAGPLLEKALERSPLDPLIYNNRGNLFFHIGKLPEAEADFRKALALRSDYAEPHNGIGSILGRRGDRSGEILEYRKALEIRPPYVEARLNLARALVSTGDFPEAHRVCREGVALSPGDSALWSLLGDVSLRLGDGKGAEEAYRNSLERNPGQPEVRSRLEAIRKERR